MNYYSRAIEILTKHDNLAKDILIEIAKSNPSAIIKGYNSLNHPNWQDEVLPILRSGQKINAIKRCRELTGMGLKEAKQAVEELG